MTLFDVVLDVRTTHAVEGVTHFLSGDDVVVRETGPDQVEVTVTVAAKTLRLAMTKVLMAVEDGSGGQVLGLAVTRQRLRRSADDDRPAPGAPDAPEHSAWLSPLLEALDGAGAQALARPTVAVPQERALRLVR